MSSCEFSGSTLECLHERLIVLSRCDCCIALVLCALVEDEGFESVILATVCYSIFFDVNVHLFTFSHSFRLRPHNGSPEITRSAYLVENLM